MGKKTTQFINKIQGEIDDLREPLKVLVGLSTTFQQQRNEFGKLLDAVQKVDEKYVGGNNQGDKRHGHKGNLEKDLANDPEKKKLSAKMDAVSKEMEHTHDWMDDVRKDLNKNRAKLNDSIKQFEGFVNKKKSSWFGSKRSVPDSEKFIKDAKDASRGILDVSKKLP